VESQLNVRRNKRQSDDKVGTQQGTNNTSLQAYISTHHPKPATPNQIKATTCSLQPSGFCWDGGEQTLSCTMPWHKHIWTFETESAKTLFFPRFCHEQEKVPAVPLCCGVQL